MPKHRADYEAGGPVHGDNPRHKPKHAAKTDLDLKLDQAAKEAKAAAEKRERGEG